MQPDEMECDAMTPGWEQHDEQQEPWARHELARAAELAAKLGGHPENAPALERTLLIAAGLEYIPPPERNDKQTELRFAA
jgi:hypothetical protein